MSDSIKRGTTDGEIGHKRTALRTTHTTRTLRGALRAGAVVALASAAALALTGCSTMETTSPSEARAHPVANPDTGDGPGAHGKGLGDKGSPVDCRKAKCIALTFDAGPSEHTPRLLKILKKEQVHATFFLLGRRHVDKYPHLVRQMDAEGHELANHTWTHKILTDEDKGTIREELGRLQDAVYRLTGKRPTLMRPPQGRTDDEVGKVSKDLGLAQILWSTTAKDYKTTDSALITKRTLDQAGRDGIILLHDLYDGTVPAVPGIIKALKKDGYTFVTVPELLAPGRAEPGEVYKP
ncbi:polysaccharide deacetylase family protein [Streptomyces sp. NA04227]|uniref:polysaccharide deacetylase family protein n=1 Tax=Streptomyces sp. NA04227 TaxID=2742136 RepID=UPI001592906D|nr:polysaccharide deacetylase family protein [Streptomyces sp. NA04227]QKW08447.1 polysaccharide deacetylase family protein [Streptomyces sp. NA04227]